MKWVTTLFTEWLQFIKVMGLLELLSFHGGKGEGEQSRMPHDLQRITK